MTIKRLDETTFAVITDTVLADMTRKADYGMKLVGNELRSHEQRGHIRTGGTIKVTLGPVSFARVNGLAVGETATF